MYIRSISEITGARLHVIGFPGAGGSLTHFRAWDDHLGPDVRLSVVDPWALHLAAEDVTVPDAARLLVPELARLGGPLVLAGHSRGAVLAYETAQQLADAGSADVIGALVAMANHAPDTPPRHRDSAKDDASLIELLHRLGGTPPEVFDEPELMETVLDRLRAELRTAEDYKDAWPVPLHCPLRLYLGRGDDSVPAGEAAGWQRAVTGDHVVRTFDGGHFFPFGAGVTQTVTALLEDTSYIAQGGNNDQAR